MKDLIRPYCNGNNSEKLMKFDLGKRNAINLIDLIEKLLFTGLYDHRMIKDDQTS